MLTWKAFSEARPDLAEAARALLYQFSVGLGFLGTVDRSGGPRVHPMCPVIVDGGLYALIVPGPKCDDLKRDGRYALHGFPPPDNEDAIYLTGRAEQRDGDVRDAVAKVFFEERDWTEPPPGFDEQTLFELLIARCLVTRTTGHGDHDPKHTIWKAGA